MHGAGPWVDRIEVDGISLRSTNKVPLDLLKEQTQVEVYRTSVQPSLTIRTAVGLALNNYTFDGRTISASLSGPAQGSLELTADGPVAVELNGFRRLHMPCLLYTSSGRITRDCGSILRFRISGRASPSSGFAGEPSAVSPSNEAKAVKWH